MAYTKKIRKKVSPQKIPTGSLSLVHKSYMVTEAFLPFISPIIKIRLQKWTVPLDVVFRQISTFLEDSVANALFMGLEAFNQ